MTPVDEITGLSASAQDLLTTTRAARVTVRVRDDAGSFPVVAEALADGVRALSGEASYDLVNAPTFLHLMTHSNEILVQTDCRLAEIQPPDKLLKTYGVTAQMLAPVQKDSVLHAVVSVHATDGPREWSASDISALTAIANRLDEMFNSPNARRAIGE